MIEDDSGVNKTPYHNDNSVIFGHTHGLTPCTLPTRYKVRWVFLGCTTARCFSSRTMSSVPNIYAYRGRHLLSQYQARHKDIPDHKLSRLKQVLRNPAPTPNLPVCIIGAGAAGLYTAMIFESLGISYQIVDADTEERVGGRLFTYHFPGGDPYDYYVSRIRADRYNILTFP